jgi:hypothetical protein
LREQLGQNKVPDAAKAPKRSPLTRYMIYIILLVAIAAMLFLNLRGVPR